MTAWDATALPLSGCRVLEPPRLVAGPACGMYLGPQDVRRLRDARAAR